LPVLFASPERRRAHFVQEAPWLPISGEAIFIEIAANSVEPSIKWDGDTRGNDGQQAS
jgi:hypothetical protein